MHKKFTRVVLFTSIFILSIFSFNQSSGCGTVVWTLSPMAVNDIYEPGQVISVCINVQSSGLVGGNWLHGVELNFPAAWDLSTITNISTPPSCSGSGGGDWDFYPNGVTSSNNIGEVFGPGFYYDSGQSGPYDGNPGNNWGDFCTNYGTNFNFCFDVTLVCGGGGNPFDGTDITPSVRLTGDGESGSYNLFTPQTPCNNYAANQSNINPITLNCCDAEAGISPGTVTICETGTYNLIDLLGAPVDAGGSWSYVGSGSWVDPSVGGLGTFDPTVDPAGDYTYTVTGTANCVSTSTITMEFIDFGVIDNKTYCDPNSIPLNDLVTNTNFTPVPAGGTWYFDYFGAQTPIPSGMLDPNVNSAGLYTYEFYSGTCKTIFSIQITLTPSGAVGCDAIVDVCTSDPCFSPFDFLGCNPAGGGNWIIFDESGAYLEYVNDFDECLNMDSLITAFAANPSYTGGNLVFKYALGIAPCSPSFSDLTVNVYEPVNTGIFTQTSVCVNDAPFILETHLDGNPDMGLDWIMGGSPFPNPFDPGTYPPGTTLDLEYIGGLTGTSCERNTLLQLTILPDYAYAGEDNTITVCESDPPFLMIDYLLDNPSTNDPPQIGGTWYDPSATSGSDYFVPGTSTPGIYHYNITSTCATDDAYLTINVLPTPVPGTSGTLDICDNATGVQLTNGLTPPFDAGGTWTLAGSGAPPTVDGSTVTDGAVYTYTVGTAPCQLSSTVTINVLPAPNAGVLTNTAQIYCETDPSFNLSTLFTTQPSEPGTWTGPLGTVTSVDPSQGSAISGLYTFTIADAGCGAATVSITITIEDTPNAGTDVTVTACPNGSGTIDLLQALGNPPGGGTWSVPSGGPTNGFFNPANGDPAGDYEYELNSAGGACSEDATVTVQYQVLTSPGTNNTITVCASDPPFNMIDELGPGAVEGTWSGGTLIPGVFDPGADTQGSFTNSLTSGACPAETATLTINVTPLPNAGTDATTSFCEDMGNVDLRSNLGGTPPGGGTWTDGGGLPVSNSFDVTGLCGNTYTFTYTLGTAGCSASADLTFDVVCPPNAGNDGSINVCSTDAPFSLYNGLSGAYDTPGSWADSNGPISDAQATNLDPSTLGTGDTFTYTVSGAPCTSASANVVVTVASAMTSSNVSATCTAAQDSYILVFDFAGGQGPYVASGTTSGTISGTTFTSGTIPAGTNYSVTISDASSCGDLVVSGNSPSCSCPVTASFTTLDQTICVGSSVNLVVALAGGTAGTYNVDYSGGGGGSTSGMSDGGTLATVSPTTTTTYTLTDVSDANCTGTASGSVTITVEQLADAGGDHTNSYCGDGSVLVFAPAAGEPTTGTFNPTQITLVPANAGVYPYTVSGNICPDDVANYTVVIDPQLSTAGVQANCSASQTDYIVTFTVSGGVPPYTVTNDDTGIQTAVNTNGGTFTSASIALPNPGGYSFTISDNGACGDINVSGSAPNCSCPVTASFASGNETICIGSSADLELDLNGGSAGSYILDYSDGSTISNLTALSDGALITVSPTTTTTYSLVSVMDGNCTGSVSGSVTITVEQLPNAGIDQTNSYCGDGSVLVFTPGPNPAGGTFTPPSITLNPANAGDYTYTMAGNVCPDDVANYTVNIDPQLTTSGLQATCSAAQTDYTVTFTISGGDGNYTVDGNPSGNTFVSAPITIPNTYSFSVDDGGPCGPITVSGNAPNCSCPVTASFASGNQTICIGTSASIELDLAGGTDGDYIVEYSDGTTTFPALTQLSDGYILNVSPTTTTTYNLISAADLNCTGSVSGSVTVTVEQLPNAGGDHTASYCGDGSQLTLMDLVNDNSEPTGGSFTSSSITLLPTNSGVYPYTMNGNVCPDDVANYTVNIQQELAVNNITAVCESNQINYTIQFTIVGGTPPYTVTNVNSSTPIPVIGSTFSETVVFLGNENYNYTISDNNGPCPDVTVSGAAPDCNCIAQGSISGSNTTVCLGDCANITFNLIGDGPFNVEYQNGNSGQSMFLNGIDNGHIVSVCPTVSNTYTLIAVSDTYCDGVVTGQPVSVTVNNPFSISGTTEICDNAGENYQVQFNINGGTPPYNFNGANGVYNTSSDPNVFLSNPIPSGNGYSISVTDAGVCAAQVVSSPIHTCACISDAGSIPATPLEVCQGGSLSILTSGETLDGNDAIQYILHDGSANTLGNTIATSADGNFTFNYSGMEPGAVYYVNAVVGNALGNGNVNLNDDCTSISNGTSVIMNPLPTAAISGGATVCPGEPVDINIVFTGEGPWDFSYSVDGSPQSVPNLSNTEEFTFQSTQAGAYTITALSDNNCTGSGSGSANIQNFVTPTATLSGNPEVCAGSGDGPEVALTGDGPWTFVYSIDGSNQPPVTTNYPTYTIPAETNGNYALVSLEGSNCSGTVSGSQNITILDAPTATITGGGTVCAGDSATFNVDLTGESPWTINYTVDGVPQSPLTNSNSNYSFQSSIDGDYVIVSVNDNNCQGEVLASQASLNVNPLPTADITTSTNAVCIGEEVDLGINLQGVPPYSVTYVLDGDTTVATGLYSNFFTTLEPTSPLTFEVLFITDGSNPTCSSTPNVSRYIDAHVLPNAPVLANDTICAENGQVSIGVNPAPGLSYSWSPETNLSDPTASNPIFTPKTNGPNATTYQYILMATNGDCTASDTMKITVDPGPIARFTFSPNPVKNVDPTVFFSNNSIARSGTAYFWVFDTLGTSTEFEPTFKFPDDVNTNYTVELTAIDPSTGCMDMYSDVVNIKPEMLIYVPSAFTPDGDGLNDLWGPVLSNIDPNEYRLTVYDRFGQVVFTTRDIKKKWNGDTNGDSYFVEEGVYVWMIETKNEISLEEVKMNGVVTVIR